MLPKVGIYALSILYVLAFSTHLVVLAPWYSWHFTNILFAYVTRILWYCTVQTNPKWYDQGFGYRMVGVGA